MVFGILFRTVGVIGLILITIGVLMKKKKTQSILFIIGGLFLLSYSSFIRDPIFIPLQSIFTIASAYELIKLTHQKKKRKK